MAIGVVCQGGSFRSGYGPGIAVIMTSKAPVIEPVVTAGANIKALMNL